MDGRSLEVDSRNVDFKCLSDTWIIVAQQLAEGSQSDAVEFLGLIEVALCDKELSVIVQTARNLDAMARKDGESYVERTLEMRSRLRKPTEMMQRVA